MRTLCFGMLILSWILVAQGCDDAGSSSSSVDSQEVCEDIATAQCERCFDCNEAALCSVIYGASSASGCSSSVKALCEEDSTGSDVDEGDVSDPECEEQEPTEAEVDACVAEISGATCEELAQACKDIFDDCSDDEDMVTTPDASDMDMTEDAPSDLPSEDVTPPNDMDIIEDTTQDVIQDTPQDMITTMINTEGCEAAFTAMCAALAGCQDIPLILQPVIASCPNTVMGLEGQIADTCDAYLSMGVPNGDMVATYLNETSAAEVEMCVSGQNCNMQFLSDVGNAFIAFIATQDPSTLSAVLAPLVAQCMM